MLNNYCVFKNNMTASTSNTESNKNEKYSSQRKGIARQSCILSQTAQIVISKL